MRRSALLAAVVAVPLLAALPAASQTSADTGHRRIERSVVLEERWLSTAGGGITVLSVDTTLPPDVARYDVVATATLEMKTSSTDHVDVGAGYHVQDGSPHPVTLLSPLEYRFMSATPGATSTSTATWSERLEGTEHPVTFSLLARAGDGPDRGSAARASGKRVTFVVDILPAAD